MSEAMERAVWRRVNEDPFEYAIQQGPHGDEFIKLLDGSRLRRALQASGEVVEATVDAMQEIARLKGHDIYYQRDFLTELAIAALSRSEPAAQAERTGHQALIERIRRAPQRVVRDSLNIISDLVDEYEVVITQAERMSLLAALSSPRPSGTLDAWIEREFAGHGRALRRQEDPPLPDEPWMAMTDAKDLTRRAVAAFAAPRSMTPAPHATEATAGEGE